MFRYDKADESSLTTALDYLYEFFIQHGPFDGILGFSQGSAMATLLARKISDQFNDENVAKRLKIILICGIEPPSWDKCPTQLEISSLHLWGASDYILTRSVNLKSFCFSNGTSKSITFGEGHNIPSMRTGIYPSVKEWIYSALSE